MTRWKRLFYYLSINILVSGCTTLAVLMYWERSHPSFFGDLLDFSTKEAVPTSALISAQDLTPTHTSTPAPTRSLISYQVQAGDTLGDIAEKFEVSVVELMDLNGITDANALGSGQILYVPGPPPVLETQTPTGLAGPLSTPTNTPLPPGQEPMVVIANVFGAGDLPTERVRLERRGEGDLSLLDWRLIDESGLAYTFPHLILYKDGWVDLYTKIGADSHNALYWGLERAVWNPDAKITLIDNNGSVHYTYSIP